MDTHSRHRLLEDFVNIKVRTPQDLLRFILSPSGHFRLKAGRLLRSFAISDHAATRGANFETITIPPYTGQHMHVLRMIKWLEPVSDSLELAAVHGSLASGEEIGYSDFDALVILKDRLFKNENTLATVARRLSSARRIMIEADPLQHHGWFVIAASDLACYDETQVPLSVLAGAKSLIHREPCRLLVAPESPADFKASFPGYCGSLVERLQKPVANLYELKTVLSRFMLLPALFYQALEGKSIGKKASFETVRPMFSPAEWNVMENVSAIRSGWEAPPGSAHVLARLHFLPYRLLAPLYPPIPGNLKRRYDSLCGEMVIFVRLMGSKMQESNPGHAFQR